jgi:DNA-binding MarR family transcriptional regulator/N-acetylglutamate synthase-like GNAT family acetyltransferase
MAVEDRRGRVEAWRSFNRFYTRQIGLLEERYLHSPFSLTEVRVLYELAHRDKPTATELTKDLGLDAGYLSRMLTRFAKRGLVRRQASSADRRQSFLSLTRRGHRVFAPLDAGAREEVATMLARLSEAEQRRLIAAMQSIQTMLGSQSDRKEPYLLRGHQPGDMGWVIHRHGALYAQEYGWDEQFEALVAQIAAQFIRNFDPKRERCWIAERDGEIVGSVFLVKHSERVAKLRLLLVEPATRGLGIGSRLVAECIRFARQAGYRKITLWTQSNLRAAIHLYEKAGFRLVAEEPHHSFGADLVAQTWELKL